MPLWRWHADLLFVWTCGLMLASGCASTPLGRMFPGREREPVITEKSHAVSRETPRDLSRDRSEEPQAKPPTRDRPPAIANSSPAKLRAIDPATQMLMDSELKGLPAEERKAWKSYLASVEPARIPHLLQARNEGIVPPEVAAAAESADPRKGSSNSRSTSRKTQPAEEDSPRFHRADPQSDLQQAADESLAFSEKGTPTIEIALEETVPVGDTATGTPVPAPERHGLDAIKIWPQGKRGERSFTDRLSSGLPQLPGPWSRDSVPPADDNVTSGKQDSPPIAPPVTPKAPDVPVKTDPQADYWQDELTKLISLMEAEASRPPEDDSPAQRQAHIQRQVYLRMLYLMAAEPEKAQLPISAADAVDQEFWTSMFWGMSNYFDDEQTGDPGTRAAQTIAQLNAAARQLQSVADLELRSVGFCNRIDGWGLYERFDRDEFEPGQAVLLYGELRNFSTESTPSGMYRTLLNSSIEIVKTGREDTVLERNDLGDTEDLCRGLRTDFYNSYRIDIPAHLTPGSYQLRLTVEDQLSGRFATQTLGFTVR